VYYKDPEPAAALALCIVSALQLAELNGVRCIAFPAISTGVYAYPLADAAEVIMQATLELVPMLKSVATIRFVLRSAAALAAFENARKGQLTQFSLLRDC
jgi:O-acetyl-ADP-ribose deacetylase (regulator of RNase III)